MLRSIIITALRKLSGITSNGQTSSKYDKHKDDIRYL